MAHIRLRKFNTRDTYPEQNIDNDLSQGVIAKGATVFLRGQVSQDLETRGSLHTGDPKLQTRKTMENIDMLLDEAGSCMEHICRIVVYLTDIRHREPIYREMRRWLKGATHSLSLHKPRTLRLIIFARSTICYRKHVL